MKKKKNAESINSDCSCQINIINVGMMLINQTGYLSLNNLAKKKPVFYRSKKEKREKTINYS